MTDDELLATLERRKWLDPAARERFSRRTIEWSDGSASEGLLEDVLLLCDRLFDRLSVLEQFDEVTSRGAGPDGQPPVVASTIRSSLVRARDELRSAYTEAEVLAQNSLDQQLGRLAGAGAGTGLKLHLGSGGTILEDWVNVDAGGDDLALNLNWGLPFPENSVSFVYAAHVLEHLRYQDQAPVVVGEILRVLKPGGVARFVVPDIGRLLEAYVRKDTEFFAARQKVYPLAEGFLADGVASLDYILLFCGASNQTLNYNHKFGYDETSLGGMLRAAGFRAAARSHYQGSSHPELLVDDRGYNAAAADGQDHHFSLFVEAVK